MEHSVLNGREVTFKKNGGDRVVALCSQNCGFRVYVARVGTKETFMLKSIQSKHDCRRVFRNKNATVSWVAKQIVDKVTSNSKMTAVEVIDDIRNRFATGITPHITWKAKKLALEMVEGDVRRQYSQLWSYYAELRRSCSGNTCKLKIDRRGENLQPRFSRFYFCFDGSKRAFRECYRPFIGVDGCHLKSQYGGQLLVAIARDPNDQNLPLAFAVVETECKDSWRWFLTQLLDDIGHPSQRPLVLLSDQQKGLIPYVRELMGDVSTGFACVICTAILKKKFGGGTMIRDIMMAAAKATYYVA